MAEYIEREAFLDAIERMKLYHQDADDIVEMLQNFPATDVRPVVLCRECKNRFNIDVCKYRGDDWFCGYGERREES